MSKYMPGFKISSSFCILALGLVVQSTGLAALDIADTPLLLPKQLEPNLIITLDDSGSMSLAAAQDSMINALGQRRGFSAAFNSLYYNPYVKYEPPLDVNGKPLQTSFEVAYCNGFDPTRGAVDLSKGYRPTRVYDPTATCTSGNHKFALHPGDDFQEEILDKPVPAYYYIFNTELMGCDGSRSNEACYEKVTVSATSGPGGTDERQNFANWYSFYRTRHLATVSAASRAFQKLGGEVRVAWQSLTLCDSFGTSCFDSAYASYDNRIRPFSGNHRGNFYKWLFRLPAVGNTPLRRALVRAGEYFRTAGINSPYAEQPQVFLGTQYSCRRNYHILMTDGLWNESDSDIPNINQYGNVDGRSQTLPDGTLYSPRHPYQDGFSNSLADLAYYYWATDLRTDLKNDLEKVVRDGSGDAEAQYWNPKNNPATWQHMVNFTVGLGLSGSLGDDWTGDTHQGNFYDNLLKSQANWPQVGPNREPGNVYDLWHAAINSRGLFFSAEHPESLQKAFDVFVAQIKQQKLAAANVAVSSTRLSAEPDVYISTFYPKAWYGELKAIRLKSDRTLGDISWVATIPPHDSRNIFTWDPNAGGLEFRSDKLSPSQEAILQAAVKGLQSELFKPVYEEVLAYLRGDQSLEQTFDASGNLTGGKYRRRMSLLGDIVNSDPVFVGAKNYGHALTAEGADTGPAPYKSFVVSNQNRAKMLYVGANDGMLHGFVVGPGKNGNQCGTSLGRELFAYAPNALMSELPKLSDPDYAHKYYVDGPIQVGDAFLNGEWRTILLGTTGAGARAIFALDVTDPCGFDTSRVLWERDHNWDDDLGYTLGTPLIVRLNNGKWGAVFGNGYNSSTGHAVLFVVNLADGSLLKKFDLGGENNGLASPTAYDADGNGTVDFIYAGDLAGRLWKIDLSSDRTDEWKIAYSGQPIFTSATGQPITAAPMLGPPPLGHNGVMVYFGTGRFFVRGDTTDQTVQSLYGVLDRGQETSSDLTRADLVEQVIVEESLIGGRRVRKTSNNPVNYDSKHGWFMDLLYGHNKGERVIVSPRREFNRVFFTTMIPSEDPCKLGGESWVMELAPDSGQMAENSIFDLPNLDFPIAGLKTEVGVIKSFEFVAEGTRGVMVDLGSTGSVEVTGINLRLARTGRVSWREIVD